MNPPAPEDNRMHNSIEGVASGENKIAEIHKHPFGIIALYVQAFVGLGVALGLMYFLVPQFLSEGNRDQFNGIMALVAIVSVIITLFILFLASVVYHQSYLIMTSKNVTQVLQKSLFKRQVSELSLANVEDVTAHQNGIFATVFNFGKLVVETAGEQNNFIFENCPRPNYYGKILLDARQSYVESDPMRATRENNRLNLPPAPQVPPPQPMPTYQVPPMPPAPQSSQPPEGPPSTPTA